MINLNELADMQYLSTYQRAKNTPTIKADTLSCLKHAATEVVEACEAYQRMLYEVNEVTSEHFASELADIVCCVMSASAQNTINIEKAIEDRVNNNWNRANKKGDKL